MGEGANTARTLSNRAANDVSPAVLADEARAIAERNGLSIDVIDPERATELGMGMFMAVGRGSDNPPQMIVMRSGGEGELDALGRHARDRRQGRLLRFGRHQHQAVRPDGRDEDGQDRRVHGHRRDRDRGPAGARHAAARGRARGREHARAAFDAPRRHRHRAQRQEGRHHQHRRRGTADPRRRDDLGGAAGRDAPRGRRHADGRRLAGPGAPRDRGVRDAAVVVRRRHGRGRARRRALLAAAADRRVRRRTWTRGTRTSRTRARPRGRS